MCTQWFHFSLALLTLSSSFERPRELRRPSGRQMLLGVSSARAPGQPAEQVRRPARCRGRTARSLQSLILRGGRPNHDHGSRSEAEQVSNLQALLPCRCLSRAVVRAWRASERQRGRAVPISTDPAGRWTLRRPLCVLAVPAGPAGGVSVLQPSVSVTRRCCPPRGPLAVLLGQKQRQREKEKQKKIKRKQPPTRGPDQCVRDDLRIEPRRRSSGTSSSSSAASADPTSNLASALAGTTFCVASLLEFRPPCMRWNYFFRPGVMHDASSSSAWNGPVCAIIFQQPPAVVRDTCSPSPFSRTRYLRWAGGLGCGIGFRFRFGRGFGMGFGFCLAGPGRTWRGRDAPPSRQLP